MSWADAEKDWHSFLEDIRQVRHQLRCSNSGAWFRGVSCEDYPIVPSIFRGKERPDHDFDHEKARYERLISLFSKRYKQKRKEIANISATREYQSEMSVEESRARKDLQALRKEQDEAKEMLRKIRLVPSGERDAYVEWCFRSGKKEEPSWLILAEMQHSGLPTRLLDWSESMLVSLFFATAKYRDAADAKCRELGLHLEMLDGDPSMLNDLIAPSRRVPAVWILNPYRASEKATNRTRIWDLSRDHYDYYEAFVTKREWPFDNAIPAFSPWSSSRIAAQQGLFTVWGHDRRPLDRQLGASYVRKVSLTPAASLYVLRLMRDFGGFDHFSIYRDLDSLAVGLKQKFF